MVHPYMRRRNGEERVVHLHPLLAPILHETLGVILFQEQVLQVAMAVAGFTAGAANGLRKAMGRKNGRDEMEKWRDTFLEGAARKGVDKARAMRIFDLICGFAEFGFCKSHAMSFALLCYRSAFLKLYYPPEFYCALLNNQPMGFYIPEVVVGDARRHGVEVLPVDVNESLWACVPEGDAIRLGFRYVKSLGEEGPAASRRSASGDAFALSGNSACGCASIKTRSGVSSSSGPLTGWSAPAAGSSGRFDPMRREAERNGPGCGRGRAP